MALRIAVNGELDNLQRLLEKLPAALSVGGRAAVVAFHSLEDRLVKRAFAAAGRSGTHRVLTPKPLTPRAEELARNPRSRSARLRGIERIR
jgi:16S rRNA (cytosine1402-N4)-methyltransferase